MNIELFTLCDGAYNYNGKLTIVGTLDSITVPSLPTAVGFGIALKVMQMPEDTGVHHLRITFLNPDGSIHPGELNVDLDTQTSSEPTHISLAANINGLPFHQEGRHGVKVYLDEAEVLATTLTINVKH